jgi:DNA-binding LytR/AlgR family response regulator
MVALILEDDLIVAKHLQRIVLDCGVTDVRITNNVHDATHQLETKPHFCFFDLRIGNDLQGIEAGFMAKQLGIPFAYITANTEDSILKKAISTFPDAYLSKPFNNADVSALVEIFKQKAANQTRLKLKIQHPKEFIWIDEILYCEADSMYTKIYTPEIVVTQRINLSAIAQKLDKRFIRIHRSFLVNTHHVHAYNGIFVSIKDKVMPVSRSHKKEWELWWQSNKG